MLREAVAAGKVPTVAQQRERLIAECIRLASPRLFLSDEWDGRLVKEVNAAVARILCDVLPEALGVVGRRTFTVDELTKGDDWFAMCARVTQGVLARGHKFRKMDRSGGYWRIRRGKGGRKPTGEWVLCLGCGVPRWATPSSPVKRCRACWLTSRRDGAQGGLTAHPY